MSHKKNLNIINKEILLYEYKCNNINVDKTVRNRLKILVAAKDKLIDKIISEYE